MERPKRNALKKWDDDFVSTPQSHTSPSVGDDNQHEKRTSLVNSEVLSTAGRHKASRVSRLSAPLPGTPKTTVTGAVPAKGSVKKVAGETKTPSADVDDGSGRRAGRPCDKAACVRTGLKPRCFVGATERCAGTGWTSRWYHVSLGEHYCNDCFDNFYRSTKDGYKAYVRWKRTWSSNAKFEANVKLFLVDRYLPFWVQCTNCSRWRQLPKDTSFSPELIRNYRCDANMEKDGKQGCDVPEDARVEGVNEPNWINMLLAPPYLVSSPVAPFLVNYRPDTVGLSASLHPWHGRKNHSAKRQKTEDGVDLPSSSSDEDKTEAEVKTVAPAAGPVSHPCVIVPGLPEILEPFLQPNSEPFALALPADKMTEDEQQHFPQYAKEQVMYLAIRNTVLALWALHPKEVLTVSHCVPHILCRGLARIRCVHELPQVIHYLSLRHYINGGIVRGAIRDLYPSDTFRGKVVVIGAGPAGLGAAHQLTKLGAQVTVLESRDRVGGRVCDDLVNESVVGRGAQLINGCVNNPFALICHQLDIPLCEVSDRCWLVDESGKLVDIDTDSKLDFHFDAMLDQVVEWKKQAHQDSNLLEQLLKAHESCKTSESTSFTPEEEQLFQFHMANLENACGASLKYVSAFYWDHNEAFAQFGGPLCVLPRGLAMLMEHLAKGIDIQLSKKVTAVNIADGGKGIVDVVTDDETYTADYVLVTLPLAILRQNTVAFSPPLPASKLQAIQNLGVGVMEKVALHFDRCFWATKFPNAQFFGRVPGKQDMRGLFSVFHAVTTRVPDENQKAGGGTLVAFLSGDAAGIIFEKTDEEIVNMCVDALHKLFPEEETIKPSKYFVTRWQSDQYASMSYSYVPVGCTADAYEHMAEPVNNRIFFAGEATNRMHPQTVTGAYLSGIREVCRMLQLQSTDV